MSGDYFVRVNGLLAGRVTQFAGEKTAAKWVAYSVATKETPKFRTRQAAADWLIEAADNRAALEQARKERK